MNDSETWLHDLVSRWESEAKPMAIRPAASRDVIDVRAPLLEAIDQQMRAQSDAHEHNLAVAVMMTELGRVGRIHTVHQDGVEGPAAACWTDLGLEWRERQEWRLDYGV